MHNDIPIMANYDDNIVEQVIEQHAEGKGVREIVRTLKNCLNTVSSVQKQISNLGVPETSTEQQTENTGTAEGTTKQRKSNNISFHG